MQKVHLVLGYLGLIPFLGLAALDVYGFAMAEVLLLSYAVLILSFLGGVVWAMSLYYRLPALVAVVSNLAMLLAWVALGLHAWSGVLYLVAVLMLLLLLFEYWQLGDLYEEAFLRMRLTLTLVAALSLMVAAVV